MPRSTNCTKGNLTGRVPSSLHSTSSHQYRFNTKQESPSQNSLRLPKTRCSSFTPFTTHIYSPPCHSHILLPNNFQSPLPQCFTPIECTILSSYILFEFHFMPGSSPGNHSLFQEKTQSCHLHHCFSNTSVIKKNYHLASQLSSISLQRLYNKPLIMVCAIHTVVVIFLLLG